MTSGNVVPHVNGTICVVTQYKKRMTSTIFKQTLSNFNNINKPSHNLNEPKLQFNIRLLLSYCKIYLSITFLFLFFINLHFYCMMIRNIYSLRLFLSVFLLKIVLSSILDNSNKLHQDG